jgi:hypothetical protein
LSASCRELFDEYLKNHPDTVFVDRDNENRIFTVSISYYYYYYYCYLVHKHAFLWYDWKTNLLIFFFSSLNK